MKKLKDLKGVKLLNKFQQKNIIYGGGLQTIDLNGNPINGHCSKTGCEGKKSGDSCVIEGSPGTCDLGSCAGTTQLLCYTA